MVLVSGPCQWSLSVVLVSGPCQWSLSVVFVSGLCQWSLSWFTFLKYYYNISIVHSQTFEKQNTHFYKNHLQEPLTRTTYQDHLQGPLTRICILKSKTISSTTYTTNPSQITTNHPQNIEYSIWTNPVTFFSKCLYNYIVVFEMFSKFKGTFFVERAHKHI